MKISRFSLFGIGRPVGRFSVVERQGEPLGSSGGSGLAFPFGIATAGKAVQCLVSPRGDLAR